MCVCVWAFCVCRVSLMLSFDRACYRIRKFKLAEIKSVSRDSVRVWGRECVNIYLLFNDDLCGVPFLIPLQPCNR